MWGMLVALLNFVPYFGPVAGVILLGSGRSAHFRHAVERTPAARLVSAAPSFGSEPHHAGVAGAPLHAQSGGHFCFLDLLDLALGCAGRFIVSADPGFDQSRLRPRPGHVVRQRTARADTMRWPPHSSVSRRFFLFSRNAASLDPRIPEQTLQTVSRPGYQKGLQQLPRQRGAKAREPAESCGPANTPHQPLQPDPYIAGIVGPLSPAIAP